jgi:Na+/H+-dicarboxylate symporter
VAANNLRSVLWESFEWFLFFTLLLSTRGSVAATVIAPGATIIFTDKPVDPTTQSHTGFQVVVAQKAKPTGTTD